MKKSRKITKQMFSFLLAVAMVFACTPISADAAKKPKLSKTTAKLRVGKKLTLKVKNTKKKAKWSIKSGKKYISLKKKKKASVVIQAKKPGTAKVVAKIGKKKLVCKVKVKADNASAEDNDPIEDDATPKPANTAVPTQNPTPGNPGQSDAPGSVKTPGPGTTTDPGNTPDPGNTTNPGNTSNPSVPENPGQNVNLPEGATEFTLGTRKLAIGMSKTDVNTVLGTSSNQEIRTGKSPQGFDTIAYNTKDYSEYLLIYLQDDVVTGICGIGKMMSFSDAAAGDNANILSAEWRNLNDYKTKSGDTAAKKKTAASNETVYAFFDALGDNGIYCIQVFDQTKIKDVDNDMIYMTDNLSYDATVTASIATEIGYMLNAFRVYRSVTPFYLNDSLARCAQDYCDTVTASKIDPRNADALLEILIEDYGVDPMNWGEACYYGAADTISFVNSLIEVDTLYSDLVGTNAATWSYIGVGMAVYGSNGYLTLDYVDEI